MCVWGGEAGGCRANWQTHYCRIICSARWRLAGGTTMASREMPMLRLSRPVYWISGPAEPPDEGGLSMPVLFSGPAAEPPDEGGRAVNRSLSPAKTVAALIGNLHRNSGGRNEPRQCTAVRSVMEKHIRTD